MAYALLLAMALPSRSSARELVVDLSALRRPPVREPVYRSQPRYCLLVFGPEGKTRVWLVQDGDTLYVDRNGDGDLTRPQDKVPAEKTVDPEEGHYTFNAGDIQDGPRVHKILQVYVRPIDFLADRNTAVKELLSRKPRATGYSLAVEVDLPGYKGEGLAGRVQQSVSYIDAKGVLQFARRPDEAPVIHFGGPWQVAPSHELHLKPGRDVEAVLGIATPGFGPGTTAWTSYTGVVPLDAYPILDVRYPPRRPGEPPLCEHCELKHRC